ncbi:MAG TPA: uroporphyrinogen-III synthase [Gaiellaceae bacterium]|nr:uroporphyrinogen-III synthase [Gaiellaceae bacterium]
MAGTALRRRRTRSRRGARTPRGRTVILTRPEGRNELLAERLRALGYDVVTCPLIAFESLDTGPIDLDGYDWLVLTSATAARELRRRARGRPRGVAAIGQATASAWGEADLVARVPTQEGLLEALPRPAGRVLFAAAEGARRLLADEFGADFVALYRTRLLRPRERPQGDLAVVASPSAARAVAALGLGVPVVSIGPQTSAAARAAGLAVAAEASSPSVEAIVSAVGEAG